MEAPPRAVPPRTLCHRARSRRAGHRRPSAGWHVIGSSRRRVDSITTPATRVPADGWARATRARDVVTAGPTPAIGSLAPDRARPGRRHLRVCGYAAEGLRRVAEAMLAGRFWPDVGGRAVALPVQASAP